MATIISAAAATYITLPVIGYIVIFVIIKQLTGNHKLAVRIAMDISTFFLFASVYFLMRVIWDASLPWVIALAMIFIAAMIVVLHYRVKGEIIFAKILKGFWRGNFAFFLAAYFILAGYGLACRIAGTFGS